MGRTYAGVLGILAFVTTFLRGLIHGAGYQLTILTAIGWMIAFAVIGALVGELAAYIVSDSIRSQLQQEAVQQVSPAEKLT